MPTIVIHTRYGRFNPPTRFEDTDGNVKRMNNPALNAWAETQSDYAIVTIPDGAYVHIIDYDGVESVIYSMSPLKFA